MHSYSKAVFDSGCSKLVDSIESSGFANACFDFTRRVLEPPMDVIRNLWYWAGGHRFCAHRTWVVVKFND